MRFEIDSSKGFEYLEITQVISIHKEGENRLSSDAVILLISFYLRYPVVAPVVRTRKIPKTSHEIEPKGKDAEAEDDCHGKKI